MMICKCDLCGEEIDTWLVCNCEPTYINEFKAERYENISCYKGEYDICPVCIERIKKFGGWVKELERKID